MARSAERRVQTLLAIVRASSRLSPAGASAVTDEFEEFLRCSHIQPTRRRRLLKILHAVRGMETTAKEVVGFHGIAVKSRSLGSYLFHLANSSPPRLPRSLQLSCQAGVVTLRNTIMHGAGAYPHNDHQLDDCLRQIEACLATLLR